MIELNQGHCFSCICIVTFPIEKSVQSKGFSENVRIFYE